MEPPSSPPNEAATVEDALSWYKSQYVQLEVELAEFRESSRELEQELEKDIERAEKQERVFQEKAEALGFEVEEWKRKYKESKTEAASAQNVLEKEITVLRDTNRSLQMKLRDSEVANDDFERQARNTTSSLEDMESKFNQAIERGVIMDEEMKQGEQEREKLRIETQRLREELGDLKIEAELMQDKIKKHEARQHHLSTISTDMSALGSPTFDRHTEASPNSTASSPLITTPPPTGKALSSAGTVSDINEPPSPPMSEASNPVPKATSAKTPVRTLQRKPSRLPSLGDSVTPKPRAKSSTTRMPPPRVSGGASTGTGSNYRTPANNRSTNTRTVSHKLPASNSLSHIRTLTEKMNRLEARVHNVRSKLPGPASSPPRASPRSAKHSNVPSSVTVRSRKRTAGSATSSITGDETTPTSYRPSASSRQGHVPRLSTSNMNRLSFGPLPNRAPDADSSRPSSRASMSSYARPPSRTDMAPPRPMSRTSTRTPLSRPRSSMSLHGHSHSASTHHLDLDIEEEHEGSLQTPSRRGTYGKVDFSSSMSGIPMPGSSIPTPGGRRQSAGRRSSVGVGREPIMPGRPSTSGGHKLPEASDLGETY
ncbi:RING finger membrane protein [Akanthomyces lecanii RCEF 1005]|uniref:RING finger membrane protein n=1 Tax=Akanthomyces lecanii RCEF 1005 TaxID=1081108 RepID=A0A168CRF8_CORDF|nr:RING finger membrane protein [Akanthomyces lecanii RCEF 1005]